MSLWAPPAKYCFVIFDFDGTLVETEAMEAQIAAEHLSKLGCSVSVSDVALQLTGVPMTQAHTRLEGLVGMSLPQDFMMSIERGLRAATQWHLPTTEGAGQMLSALKQPFALASNTDRAELARRIRVSGLAQLVEDRFVSATDVGVKKPEPDLFLATASAFGVSPAECIVVEDSLVGLEAARRAGMVCCAYLGGAHQSCASRKALRAFGPEHVITHFAHNPKNG